MTAVQAKVDAVNTLIDGINLLVRIRVPMLIQDLKQDIPLWSYFCQISDAVTSFGGYSGAVPNEKITWYKLEGSAPKFMIQSDASICAPLIFAYVLGW